MSLKQYMKMSKPALIRKITKTLTAMPKVKLARLCYNITKSKLPRLRTIRQKALPSGYKKKRKVEPYYWKKGQMIVKRKTKRKARFRKGSPEAKRYMAQLRRMRK
jgi:hypothetical protein